MQSWLSKSQRNTIPVPEKTIFLRLEICNQSISMKSPAKRKWNEEHNKGKMILLAMLLCLKTFLILKMFEGGIWSEKLLINRDIRKLNLRLILNSEERRNTLHWFRKYYIDFLTFQITFFIASKHYLSSEAKTLVRWYGKYIFMLPPSNSLLSLCSNQ